MPRVSRTSTLVTLRRGRRALARGRRAGAIAALLSCAIFPACGAPPRARDLVVVASGADLESANPLVTVHPLARQVQRFALFVTLARYDSALVAEPYFARSWRWSADRRALTLRLEPTLSWHDGIPTTAHDVAFTLEAALDPATGSPRAADLAWLERVEVIDDSSLTLHASRPMADFPAILCELAIVPRHLLASIPRAEYRRAPFAAAPVGNGPFRFAGRRAGEQWEFVRVPDFPASMGGPARRARLVIAVVDEPATKFAGLVSGELDVAGISPTMADLVRRDPSLVVVSYPVAFSYALIFNGARPPFDDVRVRRAVDLAIDRERIVRVALAGYASPAVGPVPPEHPFAIAANGEAVPPDPDSLLDAAGWRRAPDGARIRDGRPLRFTLLTVGSGDNAAEQLIQADLRALGMTVEIRQLELGAFLAEARRVPKRFDALVTGIPGDLSLSHLAAMFDSRQAGGALDYAGFHEAPLDALFVAARAAESTGAERSVWHAVQRRLGEQLPVAWLYHARGVQGMSRRLRGVRMDLRGELPTLARWDVVDGEVER